MYKRQLVQGLPIENDRYVGGIWGWFSPFAMLTGAALVAGYALLGSTWLILKTDGHVQQLARQLSRPLALTVLVFIGLVSAWLPSLQSHVMERWFEGAHYLWLMPIPVLVAVVGVALWRATDAGQPDTPPFLLAMALFVLGFLGLVLGMWPYLVPPVYTIWQAAAPPSSQLFALVGLVLLLPLILGYTVWSYRVFRGKITAETGYHH